MRGTRRVTANGRRAGKWILGAAPPNPRPAGRPLPAMRGVTVGTQTGSQGFRPPPATADRPHSARANGGAEMHLRKGSSQPQSVTSEETEPGDMLRRLAAPRVRAEHPRPMPTALPRPGDHRGPTSRTRRLRGLISHSRSVGRSVRHKLFFSLAFPFIPNRRFIPGSLRHV